MEAWERNCFPLSPATAPPEARNGDAMSSRTNLMLSALMAFTLSGCSPSETTTFDPKAGSHRDYRLETTTRHGLANRPLDYEEQTVESSLTRIEVTGNPEEPGSLKVYPLWYNIHDSDNHQSSSVEMRSSTSVKKVMKQGLSSQLNSVGGLGGLTYSEPQNDLQDSLNDFQLKRVNPAVPGEIKAEKGWQKTIQLYPWLPPLTLTVTQVTNDEIYAHLDGGDERSRIAGLSVYERETGWLKRQAITYEIQGKGTSSLERVTSVLTTRQTPYPIDSDEYSHGHEWSGFPSRDLSDIGPMPDEEDVFGEPFGTARAGTPNIMLELAMPTVEPGNGGRITLDNVELFDDEGRVETEFLPEWLFLMPNWRTDKGSMLSATFFAIKGNFDHAVEKGINKAEAQVSWFPSTPFVMELKPDTHGKATASENGATAKFKPLEKTGEYELLISANALDRVRISFPENEDITGKTYARDQGPDWLTPSESRARSIAAKDYKAWRIVLRADSAPGLIQIRVNRHDKEPKATRSVSFLTPRGQRLDPDVEPQTKPLFEKSSPLPVEKVQPEGLKKAAFRLQLPTRQARHCSLTLANDQQLAGHGFDASLKARNGWDYTGTQTLQLQTDDGIRTHFYGLGQQEILLSCDARIVWEETKAKPAPEKPWIIDPAELGITDMTVSLAQFYNQWRFISEDGKALRLSSPEDGYTNGKTPLLEVVYPDDTLRVSGKPVKFLKSEVKTEKLQRRFEVTFPDLPTPDSMNQEASE
ncbi:hypothetical protein [Marinobacter oulmenensis]|uniref:Uncharacterized protein n=1 Tax=Marinobacter oulmenensis TaxID=643747 RepID=A0A840U4X7_9GAMM|nr:hypothetical protein [Marinobacter oulmenensis]MBB5320189.1 hypothetical protein [Marinobacter oulmenensis]